MAMYYKALFSTQDGGKYFDSLLENLDSFRKHVVMNTEEKYQVQDNNGINISTMFQRWYLFSRSTTMVSGFIFFSLPRKSRAGSKLLNTQPQDICQDEYMLNNMNNNILQFCFKLSHLFASQVRTIWDLGETMEVQPRAMQVSTRPSS